MRFALLPCRASPTVPDMAESWVPLRQYAEARGVTPDAVLKAIKRGRLGLPHRRSNSDGRGSYEIMLELEAIAPPAEATPEPVPDRSATDPLQAELEAVKAHLAALAAERDRALSERDQERQRLEQARLDHAAEALRLRAQIESLAGRLADLAQGAARAGAAEADAANTRAELERLRQRGWLARLLDL